MDFRLLDALGVDKKSALLYIAGLTLGAASVQELARKSGMKRPTVYLRLDELVKQGFFEKLPIGKKTFYRAADPAALEDRLKKNLAIVQAELPTLISLQGNTFAKPTIQVLEGVQGVEQVYREALEESALHLWSNMEGAQNPFHGTHKNMAQTIAAKGIIVQEIIADTKEARKFARQCKHIAGSSYSARTATTGGIESNALLYGEVVAFLRFSGLSTVVVRIEDKAVANSMRALFEMAWNTARSCA